MCSQSIVTHALMTEEKNECTKDNESKHHDESTIAAAISENHIVEQIKIGQ